MVHWPVDALLVISLFQVNAVQHELGCRVAFATATTYA